MAVGTNRYVYCNNQPTSLIDPTGLQSIKTGAKKVGAEVVQEGTEAAIQKGAMKLVSKVADNFVGGPAAPLLTAVDVGDALAFLSAPIIEGIYTTVPDPGDPPRRYDPETGRRNRGRQRDITIACEQEDGVKRVQEGRRRQERDFRNNKDVPEGDRNRVADNAQRAEQRRKVSLAEQTNTYDP